MALAHAPERQDVLWIAALRPASVPMAVEDQQREFKRALASTLAWMRYRSEAGSQGTVAKAVGVSEATYRRWEDPERTERPDVWQVHVLCRLFNAEPQEFVEPEPLSDREREILRRALRARRPAQPTDDEPA